MSTDASAPDPLPVEDLQFEQAEYTAAAMTVPTCVACNRPIDDAYYELGGKVFCESCRVAVLRSRTTRRGAFGRSARAVLYGVAASVAGFLLYFGVLKLTGYQVGLISIVVGFMVGSAVRTGCQHRGGWAYQGLAILLTYLTIGASLAAEAVPKFLAGQAQNKPGAAAPAPGKPPPQQVDPQFQRDLRRGSPLAVVLVTVLVVIITITAPVLSGIESPIMWIIVGFALWEAWKLNKRILVVFHGPFRIGEGPALGEAPAHA
jgi:hypothetical protein